MPEPCDVDPHHGHATVYVWGRAERRWPWAPRRARLVRKLCTACADVPPTGGRHAVGKHRGARS